MINRNVLYFIISAAFVVAAGCKSIVPKPESVDTNKLGVLIIAGEGLNTTYADLKASAVAFTVSINFAEQLHKELTSRGIPTQIYFNRDKTILPTEYVAELIANNKRDGLIQIQYIHEMNRHR